MRIIAGKAKGTRLVAPKGRDIRPTLDRVREALFSILMPRLEGARFLDLFAGTGANGIEALSRGAARCTFVDNDPRSLACIRRNLDAAHLTDDAEVVRLELPREIRALARDAAEFDLVFADPPYDYAVETADAYNILLRSLRASRLIAPQGMVIIEHTVRTHIAPGIADLACIRCAEYGDTALSFFT